MSATCCTEAVKQRPCCRNHRDSRAALAEGPKRTEPLLRPGSAPRFTKHMACKVRHDFTLILLSAVRQDEAAPALERAEAPARSGQAAAGGEAAARGCLQLVGTERSCCGQGCCEESGGRRAIQPPLFCQPLHVIPFLSPNSFGSAHRTLPPSPRLSPFSQPPNLDALRNAFKPLTPLSARIRRSKPLAEGDGGPPTAPAHHPLGTHPRAPAALRSGEGHSRTRPFRQPSVRRSLAQQAPNPLTLRCSPTGSLRESRFLGAAHRLFPVQRHCTEKGRRKEIMVPVTVALFLAGCPSHPLGTPE